MSNSEAPYSYTVKHLGANLLTVRGNDYEHFLFNLKLASRIPEFKKLHDDLTGEAPATTEEAVANVQQAIPQAVVVEEYVQPQAAPSFAPVPPPAPQAVPQQAPAAAPSCSHGAMKLQPAGISKKTGKPYNAFYVCQWPNRDEQCKPQF